MEFPDPTFTATAPGHGHAYERVAEQIRGAILSRSISPGMRLPNENELATIFQVSRATIREALRSLAAEGLIATRKGVTGGSFAQEPSFEQLSDRLRVAVHLLVSSASLSLEDFMELRAFLEVPAASLAAARRTDKESAALLTAASSQFSPLPDMEQYRQNRDFHFLLVDLCHNPLLRLASQPVYLVLQTCLQREKLDAYFHGTVARHHNEIARAIEAEDGALASDLMKRHLEWLTPHYRRIWRSPGTAEVALRTPSPRSGQPSSTTEPAASSPEQSLATTDRAATRKARR